MKFLRDYLKAKRGGLFLWLVSCLTFGLVFYLYELPLLAVLYPTLICVVFWLIYIVRDIYRTKERHRSLQRVADLGGAYVEEAFLPSRSVEERDYQKIIERLGKEKYDLQVRMNQQYQNMIEYYTIWAHQIKTPLTSMRLHLQKEDSAFSRSIYLDLLRIEQYVEMVLMFLRLDSDSTDYVFRKYKLDDIVKDAVKKFAAEFIDRGIRLSYKPLEAEVITDEKWLSFVIEQIISNALKYTPSGKVIITWEKKQVLCIRDTGIGIAPEDLPRIFEKGYTGYNGRSDKKASGLGLYLCQRICKNLGHKLWVESVPDEGTAVYLQLACEKRVYE